ncbi:MAG: GNAT family N-acetyltransferase [Spirochaetales bacterium]|nr:GNAT family N-acetyltransferase [Spirochaetales bacterium]
MDVREMDESRVVQAAGLAHSLWPDAGREELSRDFFAMVSSERETVFLCVEQGVAVAFAQFSLRSDYVEGTDSSPVLYLEGIGVEERFRRKGLARRLLERGTVWGKERGCSEFASDCELDNSDSQAFHGRVGFTEVNRLVCYTKKI